MTPHEQWTQEALERIIEDMEQQTAELKHNELIDLLDRLSKGGY